MHYYIKRKSEFIEGMWEGGTYGEIAEYPESILYGGNDLIWSISEVRATQEESSLDTMPGFERILTVTSGSVVLAHAGVRAAKLDVLEQDRSPCDSETKCFGEFSAYNLLVRKGYEACCDLIDIVEENRVLPPPGDQDVAGEDRNSGIDCDREPVSRKQELDTRARAFPMISEGLFIAAGYAAVTINGDTLMLNEGDQFLLDHERSEDIELSVMGEGRAVRFLVSYDEIAPSEDEYAPKIKITFEDFKESVFIANTQFRFSQHLVGRLKRIWYDEPLRRAIERINSFYIVDIAFLLGLALIALALNKYFGAAVVVTGLIAWCVVFFLLLAPLVYLFICPRPISSHIKNVEELTPYEKELREREMDKNPRLERLMRRYGVGDGAHDVHSSASRRHSKH